MIERNKVVAYIRVSTVRQATQGTGLDRQREAITEYARKHNLDIVRWFEDSVSGSKYDRPGLSDMLDYVKDHWRVRGIIVENMDRFARDGSAYSRLQSELADMNCDLLIADNDIGEYATSRMSDLVPSSDHIPEDFKPVLEAFAAYMATHDSIPDMKQYFPIG